jgi:hypothetical protein
MSSKAWTALSPTPRPSFSYLAAPALKFGGERPERGDAEGPVGANTDNADDGATTSQWALTLVLHCGGRTETTVRVPHIPNQRARRTALKFSLSARNPTVGS